MTPRVVLMLAAFGLCTFATPANGQPSGELRFVLTNVDASRGGHIRCALYENASTWLNRRQAMRKDSVAVRGSRVTCVFRNVPAGTYGLAALHDADDDHEMDRSLVGIPEEGYAISNDAIPRIREPDFDDARIRFDGGRATIRARMNY